MPSAAREVLPSTPRALALGESYIALADDAQSIAWNPAGVARVRRYVAEAAYADHFGWLSTNHLSGVLPASSRLALGFDWHRDGFEDPELDFSRDIFRLAYSFSLFDSLSIGLNLKYVGLHLGADGTDAGTATGWGTDWGLWWQPRERWTIGAVAYNGLGFRDGQLHQGTSVRFETTGTEEEIFAARYAVGSAYRWGQHLKIVGELNDRWHLGLEYRPLDNLRLQMGVHHGFDKHRPTFSVGAQFSASWLTFSYAFVDAPVLEPTSLLAVSTEFDFQPPSVEIEKVRLRPIYPVLMHAYARVNHASPEQPLDSYVPVLFTEEQVEEFYPLHGLDNLGRIWLRNLTNRTVSFKVVVSLESYIKSDGTEAVAIAQLDPHQRASFPLRRLVFTQDVLQVTSPQALEATVEVRDVSDETRRRTRQGALLPLRGRNQVQLDDIAQLAAFVRPTNDLVRRFVRQIIESNGSQIEQSPLKKNYVIARLIFEGLRGISYASDPNIPRGRGSVEDVRFPQELLRELARDDIQGQPLGDCDDSAVLVCAALEAAGIDTALIQLPKHVLVAFDVAKIDLETAQTEGFAELCAPIDGYAWIPLETTMIGKGFHAAWREGIRQLKVGMHDSITLREAWKQYPPVDLPVEPLDFEPRVIDGLRNEWDAYFLEKR